jgi:hypothetical protein
MVREEVRTFLLAVAFRGFRKHPHSWCNGDLDEVAGATDAGELVFNYGYSTASMGIQWPFRHLIASGVVEAGLLRNVGTA